MSADNWAICPRCLLRATTKKSELEARCREGYGTLPLDEFDALRAASEAPIDTESLRTFREDYEFFLSEGGEFHVVYDGECQECGLSHRFKRVESIDLDK
jgi:hypothetical protein